MAPHSEEVLDGSETFVSSNGHNGFTPSTSTTTTTNGIANGSSSYYTNGHAETTHSKPQYSERSPYLTPVDPESEHDLICVGFGPASLAVAIALHDSIAASNQLRPDGSAPRVLFIEKQNTFSWHAGMLLPGAKMQISFVKDLASLRDPRSEFTFLNYLHRNGRLVDFTNLGTFLPARCEYEDYLRWCASFFEPLVRYNHEVVSVTPNKAGGASPVKTFTVEARNAKTGHVQTFRGRNVLFATGGQPSLPKSFPQKNPRVIHSSQYAKVIPQLLPKSDAPYKVSVIGSGQSAAEIFNNVAALYPNSQTWLVMRQEFLRPSDDSPFVNSVFNPDYIDNFGPRSAYARHTLLTEARATNYGVVRLELIEALYERMYDQRRELGTDERSWPHRILGGRQVTAINSQPNGTMELRVRSLQSVVAEGLIDDEEVLQADLVIAATGYQRTAHVDMLKGAWNLLPKAGPERVEYKKGIAGWNVDTEEGERKLAVGRNYRVKFSPGVVAEDSGVWLQGCCEGTHGLSDTLLSVLATRSGEIVKSIFGKQ